jgi:hypothetical protein
VLLLLLSSLAWCTPASAAGDPHGPGGARASSSSIGNAALDYFFPTDAADFEAGFTFSEFVQATEASATARCLADDGFEAPTFVPPQPSAYRDNTEFPDLASIRKHGFVVTESGSTAPKDPTAGLSQAEAAAYRTAEGRCGRSGQNLFAPLLSPGSALQAQWINIVSQIDAGQQFQKALVGWRSCTARAGVAVSTIDSFFSYLDRHLASSKGNLGASSSDLRLAAVYARCLGPAEHVRDQLRAQARAHFFDVHATSIGSLSTTADSLVSQLALEFGRRWGK